MCLKKFLFFRNKSQNNFPFWILGDPQKLTSSLLIQWSRNTNSFYFVCFVIGCKLEMIFLRAQIVLSRTFTWNRTLSNSRGFKVTNFNEPSLQHSLSIYRFSSEEFKLGNVYKSLFESLFRIANPRLRLHARKWFPILSLYKLYRMYQNVNLRRVLQLN